MVNGLFRELIRAYGYVYWWPANDPVEVIEGAILTQNTTWKNAVNALVKLRGKSISEIVESANLEDIIKPAGFYVQKAKYLRGVLEHFRSRIEESSNQCDTREELLHLQGIGKETADSIALYAFHQRTIPIDKYTIRLFNRYAGTNHSTRDYEKIRFLLGSVFDQEQLMEFHALIDEHSKGICRKDPKCEECPISRGCRMNYRGITED